MSIYVGIDWSEKKHDVVFMNEQGGVIGQLTTSQTSSGLQNLEKTWQYLGLERDECLVALETAHNLLIDFLWGQGYRQVYMVPPSVIKSCRGRYGSNGARTDRRDGRLIADVLRTDRARLQPRRPDGVLTQQLRTKVKLQLYLTRSSVRWSNRLRAVLLRYYPAAVHIFSSLSTQIALRFITTYPDPQAGAKVSRAEFEAFAQQYGYSQPKKLPACFARLQQPYPEAQPATVLVYRAEAELLAQFLLQLVQGE